MNTETNLQEACAFLQTAVLSTANVLRYIVPLKMLANYEKHITARLLRDQQGWALMLTLPTSVLEWDRKVYPDSEFVLFIDGTHAEFKLLLLEQIPATPVIVKTSDEVVKDALDNHPKATKVCSFISFTAPAAPSTGGLLVGRAPLATSMTVQHSHELSDEVVRLFENNGYELDELSRYFLRGAQWFGVRVNEQMVSACFIFENYPSVWEIAGVYTLPAYRCMGFARNTVASASNFLLESGLTLRYQVKWDNEPSIRLAQQSGLIEFLRLDHYFCGR